MEASINIERKHAFILHLEEVNKIWEILLSRVGPVKLRVSCFDGISRTFDSLQEFTSFENTRHKKITHMAFSSRSNNFEKSAEIEFSKGSYRVIDIRLGAPEEDLSILYDGICDILDGTRAWYSALSRIDLGFIALVIIWIISVVSSSDKPDAPSAPGIDMTWEVAGIIGLMIVAGVIVIGVFVWLMNKFRNRYFPIATFAIGQGIERYNFEEKIRWTIVVGFMVSLSASIVVSFI